MAGEDEVLASLLDQLSSPGLERQAAVLRGRWAEAGLPIVPQEGPAGREQLVIAQGWARELSVEVASLAYLHGQFEEGVLFIDTGPSARMPDIQSIRGAMLAAPAQGLAQSLGQVAEVILEFLETDGNGS